MAKDNLIRIKISALVIIELDFALTKFYKFSKIDVIEKLFSLIQVPYLEIEKRDIFLQVFPLYLKSNFSLVDLSLLYEAMDDDRELLTFDRKLKKLSLLTTNPSS